MIYEGVKHQLRIYHIQHLQRDCKCTIESDFKFNLNLVETYMKNFNHENESVVYLINDKYLFVG